MEHNRKRRGFLRAALAWLAALAFGAQPFFGAIRSALAEARQQILPRGTRREDLIDKNPADLDARHLEITPLEEFGVMGLDKHPVELEAWRLRVGGALREPLALGYREIRELPAIERAVLLICPGVFANHGRWKGVSLLELARLGGAGEGATHVTLAGPQGVAGKTARFPMADTRADRVFLAYEVNGQPLPPRHGFPLRLVAEGYYGYEWVKFVDQVTFERIAS